MQSREGQAGERHSDRVFGKCLAWQSTARVPLRPRLRCRGPVSHQHILNAHKLSNSECAAS